MIFGREVSIDCGELTKLGSKREWVPMWLWLHIVFRFGLYEIQPFGWLTYKVARSNSEALLKR
jgi:hypothetical protein